MSQLVTPQMLAAVRAVGETGLQTSVTILTRSIVEGDDGDEDVEVWASTSTVLAWIRDMNRAPILHVGEHSAVVSAIGAYRIHMPVGTVVEEGDLIGVDGAIYVVNEANNENTIRVYTTVVARKRD